MDPIRPAVLALAVALVAAALPVTAVATSAPGAAGAADAGAVQAQVIEEVPNTTNYLDVERAAVRRGDHGDANVDVGAALELAAVRVRADYNRRAFDAAYADAENETRRVERLRAAVSRLSVRVEQLRRRQQAAVQRYNAGDLSAEGLLVELAAVDAAADGVTAQFAHLRRTAAFVLPERLDRRMTALQAKLLVLQGPVRERAGAAMAGRAPPVTTYALTTTDAVVLAAVDGERFVREAAVPSNRAPGEPNQFVTDDDPSGITGANERAVELYPWAYADAGPSIQRLGTTSVYRVTLDHSQGVLETFLDGGTGSVFREFQTLRADAVPVRARARNETAGLELTVNRTYGTGPMTVRVVDPFTGEPVDATVHVNGHRVGRTGADGRLRAVTPHRQVRVNVTAGGDAVSVTFVAA